MLKHSVEKLTQLIIPLTAITDLVQQTGYEDSEDMGKLVL